GSWRLDSLLNETSLGGFSAQRLLADQAKNTDSKQDKAARFWHSSCFCLKTEIRIARAVRLSRGEGPGARCRIKTIANYCSDAGYIKECRVLRDNHRRT